MEGLSREGNLGCWLFWVGGQLSSNYSWNLDKVTRNELTLVKYVLTGHSCEVELEFPWNEHFWLFKWYPMALVPNQSGYGWDNVAPQWVYCTHGSPYGINAISIKWSYNQEVFLSLPPQYIWCFWAWNCDPTLVLSHHALKSSTAIVKESVEE